VGGAEGEGERISSRGQSLMWGSNS